MKKNNTKKIYSHVEFEVKKKVKQESMHVCVTENEA